MSDVNTAKALNFYKMTPPNIVFGLLLKQIYVVIIFGTGRQHCPMSENNITKMNGICAWQNIVSPIT